MKINTSKPYHIFAQYIEQAALDQFEDAMNQPFAVKGALMPDAHAGYSLPIGAVIATRNVIVPAWVGYDIGCGMCAIKTTFDRFDVLNNAEKIFDDVYKKIPTGFSHNQKETEWDYSSLKMTDAMKDIFNKNGLKQLGSLGSGNHFIEVGADESDAVWIIIHSGSRGIGHAVATRYMKLASPNGKAAEGHYGFDDKSQNGIDYIKDLKFCLSFALQNRLEMISRMVCIIKNYCVGDSIDGSLINRNHNHAEFKDGLWIHRKGATHAENGMMGVIPGNMRDGSFIVCGKGNPGSLFSSSHGAGRVLGRKVAKQTLNMDDFSKSMDNIVAKVDESTLDESPFAYKDIFAVMDMQSDLVEVIAHVSPILNIKG